MSIETLAKQGQKEVHIGLAGIDSSKLKKMRNEHLKQCFHHFNDTQYRMEYVARIRGTEFINDAASRTVNATWYALESIEGNLIWIANGGDAKAEYEKLLPVARQKVRMIVCVGNDNQHLHETFSGSVRRIVDAKSINEAVHTAFYSQIENAKILFSPACENGMPVDNEGQQFTMEVNEL